MNTILRPFLLATLIFFLSSCSTTALNHSLEKNGEFEILWTTNEIHINYNNRRSDIVGAPGRIIISGWMPSFGPQYSIIGLDSISGDLAWRIPGTTKGDSIITQDGILYRGTIGTADVISYKTESGKLLWKTPLPLQRSTLDLYVAEGRIFVYTNNNGFFILNEQGVILDSVRETSRTFLEMDGDLFMEDVFSIKAVDTSSRTELWRLNINQNYTEAPIFDNSMIFLKTNIIPIEIYSIDQDTGEVNWKLSQDVLSNLVVLGDKIYFVTFDSCLVVIDRDSGNELAKVKFSPPFDLDKQIGGYFITGDPLNNVLAVSFGDNYQTMGLRLTNP